MRYCFLLLIFVLLEACNSESESGQTNELQELINKAQPGDTVRLAAGIYKLQAPIQIIKNASVDKPLVIMGPADHSLILDATDILEKPDPAAAVWVAGSYITLQNITVKNSHDVGILVGTKEHPSRHITLNNNLIQGTYGSGIGIWYADSVLVSHCEITGANDQELRREGVPLGREAPHEALTIAGATNFTIVFNKIHDCVKEGIDVKEVSQHGVVHHNYVYNMPRQGLYADAWFGLLKNVEFRYNVVHDSEWGAVISVEGEGSRLENVHIHDNLLYDNRGSGIFFGQWGHDLLRENIMIYNNTVVGNGSEDHWAGLTGGIDLRSASVNNVEVFNNVVFGNKGFGIATFAHPDSSEKTLDRLDVVIFNNMIQEPEFADPIESDYNLNFELTGNDPLLQSPNFNDVKTKDFRLVPGSPGTGQSQEINTEKDLGADMHEIAITLEKAGLRKTE